MAEVNPTQCSFNFAPKPDEEAKDIQQWVERHNRQTVMAARTATTPFGSLLGAIDRAEAKTNAVYLLRGLLNQSLRKSMGSRTLPPKSEFLRALKGEMTVKKTARDPAFTLRDILIKLQVFR